VTESVDYYNIHAEEFFNGTNGVDMTEIYRRFLPLIPEGGSILDAGCGSGRDAKAFTEMGYRVDAFDASPSLVELANSNNGIQATIDTFDSYSSDEDYDGIWACASLLHVPFDKLAETIESLSSHLKSSGVFYLSFKLGVGERDTGQRIFTDMTLDALTATISEASNLNIAKSWITQDLRQHRNEKWLNALLMRIVQK